MTLLAAVLAIAAPTPAVAPRWEEAGCNHGHRSVVARQVIKQHLSTYSPYPKPNRIRHWTRCVATLEKSRALRKLAKRLWTKRHTYANIWKIRFFRLSKADRNWAYITGECESGNDPNAATGNGFFGAHQWLPSTWAAADSTGMWVTGTSWYHQAVVAVRWRNIAGSGQWPNCAAW